MSQAHKEGPKPKAKRGDLFPLDLFTALHKGDDDEAVACLRAEAMPDGGTPSPRAAALMNSGEWDSNQKLSLVLIELNACNGKIGNDDYRFCGKASNFCSVAAHSKNSVGPIKPRWYISFGKAHGVLTTPFLPTHDDGGPITSFTATRLLSADPFRLTKGQWKFVIDSWHALNVDSFSEPSQEEQEFALELDTQVQHEHPPSQFQFNAFAQEAPTTDISIHSSHNYSDDGERGEVNPKIVLEALIQLKEQVDVNAEALQQQRMGQVDNERRITELTNMNRNLVAEGRQQTIVTAQLEELVRRLERRSAEETLTFENRMRNVVARLTAMESSADKRQTGGDSTEELIPQGVLDKVEELDVAVFGSSGTFARLKEGFIDFKEKLESGGGVECHGVSFKSQRDFLQWYAREGPTVDIFLDSLAFMHAIRAPVVHMDDATRQLDLQMKTSLGTGLEASVLTSFETILPSILVGSGGKRGDASMGGTHAWLSGYLKTFKTWKPAGSNNGVSHQINDGVKSVNKRVIELRKQFVSPDVMRLSTGLCQDSALFCNEFVRFINEQQEDLTNNTTYSEEQVWAMQLECIQKIIEELSDARVGMADAGRAVRGNYVWGMLMAWKIQTRYMENHFKDDPALTGVLVRRILMQGQDQSVKKQLAKIDLTDGKLEEYRRNNNAEVKKVKDDLTKLKEDVGKIKK